MTNKLLTINEVSEWLSLSKPTLWKWIAEQKFPAPTKLGRSSRWRQSTIEDWLSMQEAKADAAP